MKKRLAIFVAIFISASSSHIQSVSFMETCRYNIATTLAVAVTSILEIATATLAMEGDPIAAEVLLDMQRNKTARQMFCEAGTMEVTGMFNHLVATLSTTPAIKSAIENALYLAIYKVMEKYTGSWF